MSIENKIKNILNEIPKDVTLIAVSKTKPVELIMEAYNASQRDFGENKVQDLISKKEVLPKDIRWHFIGKLQTNKVKYLVNNVYLIHSLSSIKLAEKIENEFGKSNSIANVLIQINIGREESKSGILEEDIEDLISFVEECNFIKVNGIMVIIPKGSEEENRYYFRKTKSIYEELKKRTFKNIKMEVLSMGMTNDYKIAIEEGATTIRVGSGIFGARDN
ncbi:YggS family pyridoxal phosphate-dependent enzyme [Clostridium celatum]|uniref:YggS family pyridoxal phosphate-dependent enzyme n=1 Tax=Clostridium celatum TaxID=36834 RepID=UPI0018989CF9|nr:YggS family pyridoxal phosphate-dependent enzyme [Clostridium celatum]MDU3723009.1 YggS family pyridoxal phosphate-dependent enzyme [Clostridium celatum]MDU6294827.1 YggS family pyridoxal phosphate-dependent enzyme [Clostridium celatum]MDY3359268.1 YggS family pyridoxal phosphate-dependent enzyme [Clostridium celatum]